MHWKFRYTILSILFLTYVVSYMDRMVMATTIPYIADEFKLSTVEMGSVMSAFFVTYSLIQIPGGMLADKFGPRVNMVAGIAWWTIFTAATGMASSLKGLIIVRALFGLGEGVHPPSAFKTISMWFPKKERGRAISVMFLAQILTPAVAPLIAAAAIITWGWRETFYLMAIPGIPLIFLVWKFLENPENSQLVSLAELSEIKGDQAAEASDKKFALRYVLTLPLAWKCFFTVMCSNMISWGLLFWMPTYYIKEFGFSPMQMGIYTAIPLLSGAVGMLIGGYISDRSFHSKRKVPIITGILAGSLFLYLNSCVTTASMAITCQSIAFFFLSIALSAFWALPTSVLPSAVIGSAAGFINAGAQLAGMLSPLIVGYLINVSGDFTTAFMFFAACGILAALITTTISE